MTNGKKNLRPFVLAIILSLLFVYLAAPPCAVSAEHSRVRTDFIFAVIPQKPPEVMWKIWEPFIERLSRDTGLNIGLKVYENMNDFENDLKEGRVGFAYMNPVQEITAWNTQGYIPLVRNSKLIKGEIFVRRDSGLTGINDLAGKQISFIGTQNVCSVVLQKNLQKLNITPHYVGSSSNVYKAVTIGDTVAGGTLDIAFEADASDAKTVLQSIYSTPPLSSHPIAAHPTVSVETRQMVMETVLRYTQSKEGQILLKSIKMPDPVTADYSNDYKPLAQLLSSPPEQAR
ncbi:MAG: phosphate/phosphite/phosphonate ABC transporter substrate-binding protein [Pseudomonadota bacterium]